MMVLLGANCPSSGSTETNNKNFYVYAVNQSDNTISMFQGDATGALTYFGKVSTGLQPAKINFMTSYDLVYVANAGDSSVSIYRILPSGYLQAAGNFPTGSNPVDLEPIIPSTSHCLNVLCSGSNQLIEYRVNDPGSGPVSLSEIARMNVPSGAKSITSIRQFDTSGHAGNVLDCYVPCPSANKVAIFVESDTGFTALPQPSFAYSGGPSLVVPEFIGADIRPLLMLNSSSQFVDFNGNAHTSMSVRATYPTVAQPVDLRSDSFQIATIGSSGTIAYYDTRSEPFTKSADVPVGGTPTAITQTYGYFVSTYEGSIKAFTFGVASPTPMGTYSTNASQTVSLVATGMRDPSGASPIAITTGSLPNGTVGASYSAPIATAGGRAGQPITWSVSSGTIPPGLSVSNGVVSGTPTTAGTYAFTIQAVQGASTSTKSYTIVVSGSGGSPGTTRFLNAATVPAYASMTLKLGSTSFPSTAYGALSTGLSIPTGGISFDLQAGGSSQLSGSTVVDATNRMIFVALGAISADLQLSSFSFAPTYPGSSTCGISFMNGIPTRDLPSVDVYVYAGATLFKRQLAVPYGGVVTCALPPGSYTVQVTEAGIPASILATSRAQTLASGENGLDVIVSPESAAATFVQAKE